jgi:hypothetical protein
MPTSYRSEQRNELAPPQLIQLHLLPLSRADTIAEWRPSRQGLIAVRDFSFGTGKAQFVLVVTSRAARPF